MKRFLFIIALAALLLSGVGQVKAGTIDTTPSWDGSTSVSYFGVPDTATYGQTITATAALGTVLDNFTFHINDNGSPQSLKGYVYQWDSVNDRATGPALFTSSTVSLGASNSFQTVTFNTGGVNLVAGQQYVLFGSVSDPFIYSQGDSDSSWGSSGSALYSGGSFVYLNNGNDESQWTSTGWSVGFFDAADLAFTANFSSPPAAVPEPASLALLGIASVGLAGYGWRRRKVAMAV